MPLADNLVSYWKLNEASGNAIDSHTGGNTGTVTGATQNAAGKLNSAYSFDGTDDNVDMGDAANLSFEFNEAFSVSFWLKTNQSGNPFIIGKQSTLGHTAKGWVIMSNDVPPHRIYLQMNSGASAGSNELQVRTNDQTTGDNTYRHIVVTHSGSGTAAGVTFYVDNVVAAKATDFDTLTATIDNAVAFRFGETSAGTSDFSGSLDEVGIWSRELTASEVSRLFNSGAGLSYEAIVGVTPSGMLNLLKVG